MNKSVIITGALKHEGDLRAYGIMCRLDEGGGGKHFFLLPDQLAQKNAGIFQAAISCSRYNGVRLLHTCFPKASISGSHTHFDDPAHPADGLCIDEGGVIRLYGF